MRSSKLDTMPENIDGLKAQYRQQVATELGKQVATRVGDLCVERCFAKFDDASLMHRDIMCLSKCGDRFADGFELVAKKVQAQQAAQLGAAAGLRE